VSDSTWLFKTENINTIRNHIIRREPGIARFKGPLQTSTQSNEIYTGRLCNNKNGLYV
jgi:hypothetical protein